MKLRKPQMIIFPKRVAQIQRRVSSVLKAAAESDRQYDGRITAAKGMPPDAAPEGGLSTLGMMPNRLQDSFLQHDVVLSNGPTPPGKNSPDAQPWP